MKACQTDGSSSIPILIEHGADVNFVGSFGLTALGECFSYGTIGCLRAILPHQKVSGRQDEFGIYPMMQAMREDHSEILEWVLFDPEARKLVANAPCLSITESNIQSFLFQAYINRAEKCIGVIQRAYREYKSTSMKKPDSSIKNGIFLVSKNGYSVWSSCETDIDGYEPDFSVLIA